MIYFYDFQNAGKESHSATVEPFKRENCVFPTGSFERVPGLRLKRSKVFPIAQ